MTLGASPDQLRLFTPEIFWHGREEGKRFVPGSIQGVDVSASGMIATAGNDSKVRLWRLGEAPPAEAAEAPAVVLYQELDVHEKAVNAVRFSPDGATLASAADDNLIILWRDTGTRQQASFGSSAPQGEGTWKQHCVLRGHIDDVYDLAWSPCGGRLLSGCVDGSCIVWGVSAAGAAGKGVRPMQQQLRDHEHYVQGVCWDPRGELVASVSCDRSARVYKAQPAAGKGAAPSFTCAASIQKTKRVGLDPDTTAAASQAAAAIERAAEPAAADLAPPKGEEPPAEVAAPAAAASTAPGPVAPPTPLAADADAAGPARLAEPAAAAISDGPAARREGVASAAGGEKRPVAKESRLFLDESVPSFFRRPAWSPCGSFLLLPCGQHARASDGAQVSTCHVFARANLTAPCAHLPGAPKAVVAVRCCPTLFKLRPTDADVDAPAAAAPAPAAAAPAAPAAAAETLAGDGGWMGLPYRVIWAVASLDSLIVYDSQQRTPLLVASGIHYAALTDLAWLPAGRGLIVSSADGFCSILLLAPGALGEPLPEEELPSCMRPPAAPVEVPAAEAAEGVAVDVAPAPVVEGMEVEATAVAAAAAAPAATGEAPAPGAASGATTGGTVALKPGEAHSDGLQVKKKPKRVVPIETSV